MKNYGKAIKALRKTANMTQAQLADKLSVTPQTVSKWENGVNTPDIDAVENMCSLFAVSMDEFMRMADENAPSLKQPVVAQTPSVAAQPNQSVAATQPTPAATTQPAPTAEAPTVPASTTAPAKTGKRIKPLYLTIISIVAAVIAFVAVFVPIYVTRKHSLKVLSANEIYQKVNPSVFYIEVETESDTIGGSGFFINNSGTAVTNYHVVNGIQSASVTLSDGKTYKVDRILGVDNERDVALIHVAVSSSIPVTFADSSGVKTGDKVYAIGFPQSFVLGVQDSTLTEGLVSKSSYNVDGVNYIQSTVDITHGNSGGVLVDVYGRVIGMTSAGIDFGNIDYMNLSIPANTVKSVKPNVNLTVTDYSAQSSIRYEINYIIEGEIYAVRSVSAMFGKIPNIKPALVGAEFLGWYADAAFKTPFDFSQTPTDNVNIYGKIEYTDIIFEFSGGTGSTGKMDDVAVGSGEKFTFPDNGFKREGYAFTGWELDGANYAAGDVISVSPAEPIRTVYAKWKPIVYDVVYSYNGEETSATRYAYDKSFTLKDAIFTRPGHKQVGWRYNGKTYDFRETVKGLAATNNAKVEITPEWKPIQYLVEVTFREPEVIFKGVKYGTNTGNIFKTFPCTYGVDPFEGAIPSRDPFVFDGWHVVGVNSDVNYYGGVEFADVEERSSVVAEAVWMSCDYTLTFEWQMMSVELSGRQSYTIPTIEELDIAQYNPGQRFVHWKNIDSNPVRTYADGETVSDLMFDGYYRGNKILVRLYSVWEYIDYTVKFDGNGGTGDMQGLSCVYGTAFTLPKNTFVRSGYSFVGWEHGDEIYADESEVNRLTTEDGGEVTLKAKWIKDYDGDGTESSPYRINNYTELADLSIYVDSVDGGSAAHYVLTADVDCTGKMLYPIGVKTKFTGVFDGCGHIIKNVVFAPSDDDQRIFGLFGFVLDGQIKNVGIEQYDYVRGGTTSAEENKICGSGAGAIAYYYESSHTLEKCYATTTKSMDFTNIGITYFGGLVGSLKGKMENCYAAYDATLTINDLSRSRNVCLGGLAGIAPYSNITHCYSDVNIYINKTVTGNPDAYMNFGLLTSSGYKSNIDYCFTAGSIVYGINQADAYITMYDERNVGLISGVGTDGKSATALYTAGKITFADMSEANGGVYEGQQTANYEDLCSVTWLNQNLDFDTTVWKESHAGLPTFI